MYRLTALGSHQAARAQGEMRKALFGVYQAQDATGWADERLIVDGNLLPYHTWNVRSILKRYVTAGYLERKRSRSRHHVPMVTLTEIGVGLLEKAAHKEGHPMEPATRPPRLDNAVHHLLVIESAMAEARRRKAGIRKIWGDEDLRSRQRKGKKAQGQHGALPDGRIVFEPLIGAPFEVDLEVLISKYTDVQIAEKYACLGPDAVFYATTSRLCLRVAGLVGKRPFLLGA